MQLRGSIRGAEVRRAEDPRFVTGEGRYLGDMPVEGALWAVFVRSTVPHAIVTDIDADAARDMEGVVGVFTAADFDLGTIPPSVRGLPEEFARPLLSSDRVRFVGDPVAVVVAETEVQAFDAAEAVWVDYEGLPAVTDLEQAMAPDAPLLFPEAGTNVITSGGLDVDDDVLDGADVVVGADLMNQRVAPVPLETNNALAVPRDDGGADIWLGSQSVHLARNWISRALGIDRDLFRVRVPDMGGGFGAKINVVREQLAIVALALELGRPVRWQEGRGEGLLGMPQGRAQLQRMEIGAKKDGTLVGLRWRVVQDAGAYPADGAVMADLTQRMASGPYAIPRVDFRWQSVVTNTTPIDSYRGAGRPEAAAAIERMMDLLAAELDMDPADLRRINYIPPSDFPHVTATGERYDSGDYTAALALALKTADYAELRADQEERRRRGDRFQLG